MMSYRSRRRNRDGNRRAGAMHAEHPAGRASGRMGAQVRWDGSGPRASTAGTMPRLGAVLLAILVVALLTIGLHVLFQ